VLSEAIYGENGGVGEGVEAMHAAQPDVADDQKELQERRVQTALPLGAVPARVRAAAVVSSMH